MSLSTATAERFEELETFAPTPLPSQTPVPPCQDFVVDVPSAIIRELPTTNSALVDTVSQNETVCVIAKLVDSEWYEIDKNPLTRRLEPVYMHEDIIRALNPTLTPSTTFTLLHQPSQIRSHLHPQIHLKLLIHQHLTRISHRQTHRPQQPLKRPQA